MFRVEHGIVSPPAPQSAHILLQHGAPSAQAAHGAGGMQAQRRPGQHGAPSSSKKQKDQREMRSRLPPEASTRQHLLVLQGITQQPHTAGGEKLGVQRAHAGGAGRDAQEGLQQDNSQLLPWPTQEAAGRSTLTLRMISKRGTRQPRCWSCQGLD